MMARKIDHSLLDRAKINKKDEFYTQLADIERELSHYEKHFRNKTVFCNCDDVRKSNFYRYFVENFERLGLKKIICACYRKSDRNLFSDDKAAFYYEFTGKEAKYPSLEDVVYFKGDGDFRSGERIVSPNNCMWLTNLDNACRHEFIPLIKEYRGNEATYPKFDNYDAINVGRTRDIPFDYKGVMGVPITFLHKFNPDQFKIVKFRKGNDEKDLTVGGKPTYFRILIQSR